MKSTVLFRSTPSMEQHAQQLYVGGILLKPLPFITLCSTENDVAKINLITQPYSIKSHARREASKEQGQQNKQDDSSCVFEDKTKRHTNINFLFFQTGIFTLIINHLTNGEVITSFYNPVKCVSMTTLRIHFQK